MASLSPHSVPGIQIINQSRVHIGARRKLGNEIQMILNRAVETASSGTVAGHCDVCAGPSPAGTSRHMLFSFQCVTYFTGTTQAGQANG